MSRKKASADQVGKAEEKNLGTAGDSVRRTYSVEEAGRILGISRQAAYQYARNGTLPVLKLGKRMLVPKVALEKLLAV